MNHNDAHFELVVGIDYSDLSEAVFHAALDIAQHRGGRVHVISVADGFGPPRLPDDLANEAKQSYRTEALQTLEAFIEERCARLEQEGRGIDRSSVDASVDFGHPQERILALAEKVRADIIAVGLHGKRGVERLVLGSVAENVLRHAPCSVLVVRR